MDVRILGPIEAYAGATPLRFPRRQQRLILGILALHTRQVVPLARLTDLLWGGEEPDSARAIIHTRMSEVRGILSRADTATKANVIAAVEAGYRLDVPKDRIDIHQFRQNVSAALRAASLDTRRDLLLTALRLWRGEVFGGWLPSLGNEALVHGLETERLTALEAYYKVELSLGRHHEVVDRIVEASTLYRRETLIHLAMLALCRCSRAVEALQLYEAFRTWVRDELGVEPVQELRDLHLAILRDDTAALAGEHDGGAEEAPNAVPSIFKVATPATLPARIPDFVGRWAEHAAIADHLTAPTATPKTAVVTGPGGVGKTTLAVQVAHEVRESFPDGQLFVDAYGFHESASLGAFEIMGQILRNLGVTEGLPHGLDERVAVYRQLTQDRRLLIVIDNVASLQDLHLVLPASATSAAIITSRHRFAGAIGAAEFPLAGFHQDESIKLLDRIVGAGRVTAERQAAEEVCTMCGHLPLAVRIVGARLASKPHWAVAQVVQQLSNERRRLDRLVFHNLDVRASMNLSLGELSHPVRRLLAYMGLLGLPSTSAWAAACLMRTSTDEAESLLEQLHDSQLAEIGGVQPNGYVKYELHDLVRIFAAGMEEAQGLAAGGARFRLSKLYLALIQHAKAVVAGGLFSGVDVTEALEASLAEQVAPDPLLWFESEKGAVIRLVRQAAADGDADTCWRLAEACSPLFQMRNYHDQWLPVLTVALDAVRKSGCTKGEAVCLYRLATYSLDHLDHDTAVSHLTSACVMFGEAGDDYGKAVVLTYLATVDRLGGRTDDAISKYVKAAGMLRRLGDTLGVAFVLRNQGQALLDKGDVAAAEACLDSSMALLKGLDEPRTAAQASYWMGVLRHEQHRFADAAELFSLVLTSARRIGDRSGEAQALRGLAKCYRDAGQLPSARAALRRALPLVAQPQPTRIEAQIREDLAAL